MSKAQIYFSNHLEELISPLKENLFPSGAGPFEKRLIVVPHLGLKAYLMQALAKDPDLQIAAGLQIVNLSQAWTKITKKTFPSTLELSLFLQHCLIPMIEQEPELKRYFEKAYQKRIGPFCDALAQYFSWYAVYGKGALSTWQEKLWKAISWTFPHDKISIHSNWQIHLFGFTFIPKSYFSFFQNCSAHFYLFSPCEIFWGDFYSDKEKSFLSKEVPESQLNFFEKSFEDQNPLLASWGKVGRQMLLMAEESNIPATTHYIQADEKGCLHRLQNAFLQGSPFKLLADPTIRCFSAATPLHEMEILKDTLLHLFAKEGIEPRDVQVFAPDISEYAPYIHAAFSEIPYAISDLPLADVDEISKAFSQLIALPQKRFALEEVLQVLDQMKAFEFNMGQVRKWLSLANVRWGFSKQQRRSLYLQDLKEDQLNSNSDQGTWQKGLKRLLLGLGHLEGEEAPLCAIANTEMEEFNRLYTVVHALADDLAPFYDGTTWTIPTWLRYFACLLESYFAIDPAHDLYKQLQQMAAACDHLDREEIPYVGMQRVLTKLLGKKSKSHQPPHLQAIRFSSLLDGSVQPCKAVCLIGMQEEAFPRREESASLHRKEEDYRPKQSEIDRSLFLQSLCSARAFFQTSYVRDAGGKLGASLVVQELLSHLEGAEVIHHRVIAKTNQNTKKKPPLIKEFYELTQFLLPSDEEREIELQKLFKFAKHPLRYYFHEVLGIYPDFAAQPERGEYLLDPLLKHQLVREGLQKSIETVFSEAEKRGVLPLNLLKPLAKGQVTQEIQVWQDALDAFDITPEEIQVKKVDLTIGNTRLVGKLDLFTSKGLLVRGKDCLEDRIRFWPQALLMQEFGLPLLLVNDQKPLIIEGSLAEYLEYFTLASHHPSPLLPTFAKALLQGTPEDLKKALLRVEDEIWTWLNFRDPIPSAQIMYDNWSEKLQNIFGRVDAAV
ncbi:MAG: RecBCD enzyme subunit RecC [Chlamydiae bacterium]|nr:RecBCD enzyme subunit RecC [Chlamydiota bacterium]